MTQELRKLAEAATQGEWWIDSHGMVMSQKGGRKMIFMTSERMGEPKRNPETGNLSRWPNDHDATYIAAANPAAILALLDRLEAAEKDAERYRWLRDTGSQGFSNGVPQRGVTIAMDGSVKLHFVYWMTPHQLDESIDEAMEAIK